MSSRVKALEELDRKAIGFTAGAIRIFGYDAVEPGVLPYVVRAVETGNGVIKLSLAVRPTGGQPDGMHVQIAIGGVGELSVKKEKIRVKSADYVRYEEMFGVVGPSGARIQRMGEDMGAAAAGAVALELDVYTG